MIPSRKRVTLKDVAERCGYSVNTVSRALRNDTTLPAETMAAIQKTASEMGYIRNALASSLRSGKSNIIAIIVEEIQNQHYSSLISQMDMLLREKGYTVLIISSIINDDVDTHNIMGRLISFSIDGILFFPYSNNSLMASLLLKNHIPFVLIDREITDISVDLVRSDDYQGGYLAGTRLFELGHQHFAYICGPLNNSAQPLRQQGFLDALKDRNVPDRNIRIIYSEQLLDEILRNKVQPSTFPDALLPVDYTAIFSFNDQIAYYAINCLMQTGYQIPEDISVIGFDYMRKDIPYLLPLTSISYPEECSIAKVAVDNLLSRMDDPSLTARRTIFPVCFYEPACTISTYTKKTE